MAILGRAWELITGSEPLVSMDVIRLLTGDTYISETDKQAAREVLRYDDSISLDQMTSDCYQWMLRAGVLSSAGQ